MNVRRALGLTIHFFGAMVLWQSCSSDRIVGGSSETENAIVARFFFVDSLLSPWNHSAGLPTVAVLRLDSTQYNFETSNPQGLELDFRLQDSTPLPFEISHWDISRRMGRINIRIDPGMDDSGAQIVLWRGPALIDRSNPAGVWFGIPDSLKFDLTSVLVDDFEDANTRTSLPDSSSWFLASGSQFVNAGAGRLGNAVYLTSSATGPQAMAAALLASTPRRLPSVDSIVFWARGTGRIFVALEHALPGSQLVAWAPHDLDTAWSRIRIIPDTFNSAGIEAGGARWEDVRDSVTHLSFYLDGSGTFWLDDPRVYGINRDDLR